MSKVSNLVLVFIVANLQGCLEGDTEVPAQEIGEVEVEDYSHGGQDGPPEVVDNVIGEIQPSESPETTNILVPEQSESPETTNVLVPKLSESITSDDSTSDDGTSEYSTSSDMSSDTPENSKAKHGHRMRRAAERLLMTVTLLFPAAWWGNHLVPLSITRQFKTNSANVIGVASAYVVVSGLVITVCIKVAKLVRFIWLAGSIIVAAPFAVVLLDVETKELKYKAIRSMILLLATGVFATVHPVVGATFMMLYTMNAIFPKFYENTDDKRSTMVLYLVGEPVMLSASLGVASLMALHFKIAAFAFGMLVLGSLVFGAYIFTSRGDKEVSENVLKDIWARVGNVSFEQFDQANIPNIDFLFPKND